MLFKGEQKKLDSKICNEVCLDQNILSVYEKLKKELQEIYEEKGRGAIFRSKARWTENGENLRNISLTLRKQDMRRKLFHNYKSERINLYHILNKLIKKQKTTIISFTKQALKKTIHQKAFKDLQNI